MCAVVLIASNGCPLWRNPSLKEDNRTLPTAWSRALLLSSIGAPEKPGKTGTSLCVVCQTHKESSDSTPCTAATNFRSQLHSTLDRPELFLWMLRPTSDRWMHLSGPRTRWDPPKPGLGEPPRTRLTLAHHQEALCSQPTEPTWSLLKIPALEDDLESPPA